MNILSLNFTGNLTDDATLKDYEEKKKSVYNFTVAVNISENNTVYLKVSYWTNINTNRDQNGITKLLSLLKKGSYVAISANSITNNTYTVENKEDNTTKEIREFQIIASRIDL